MKYSPALIVPVGYDVGRPPRQYNDSLIVNGQIVNSTDVRCNSGAAIGTPLSSSTMTDAASDELGFVVEARFGHPGIQLVYLSWAPDGVGAADYHGSGDWANLRLLLSRPWEMFTIGEEGLPWAMRWKHPFRFPLSRTVPEGEYLLRAGGLALHAAHELDCAQFYVGCAQTKVVGNGTGVLSPLMKISGVLIPDFWRNITNYTEPGPALWPEGSRTQHVVKQLDS
ncbi:glycosyl hydrolase family 61 [Seiridium cupressi]